MRRVSEALDQLAKRVGFRIIPGLGERVIYRELFPKGLTLLDSARVRRDGAEPCRRAAGAARDDGGAGAARAGAAARSPDDRQAARWRWRSPDAGWWLWHGPKTVCDRRPPQAPPPPPTTAERARRARASTPAPSDDEIRAAHRRLLARGPSRPWRLGRARPARQRRARHAAEAAGLNFSRRSPIGRGINRQELP